MITFTRKTIFWGLFVITSIGATLFSLRYFSRAFPIVNLDIRMSRQKLLEDAASIAKQYNLGPTEYRQLLFLIQTAPLKPMLNLRLAVLMLII